MATSGSFNTSAYSGRYLNFSWTEKSQSVANNTTTISWTLKGAGGDSTWYMSGNFKVVIDGSTVYSSATRIQLKNGTVVASGTYTFKHDSAGKKTFSASAEAGIYTVAVNCRGSGSFTLDTIARKSTLAASNGTLGTAQTLTVTRQSTSLTHTVTYKCGSASGTIVSKSTSTSISWTPPLSLASQNTTGTSVSVTFTIETFTGSTSIGSNTKTISCAIPASVKPSCSISVSDPTGYDATYGGYVQGQSKFKITVATTTSYGSAIASYDVKANGASYTSASVTTGVINSSGTLTISATVKDKRSRTGTASVTKTVLAYSPPKISAFSVGRCNSDGTANDKGEYVKATFSYAVTSLSSKNKVNCSIKYKKSSASSYATVSLSALSGTYSVNGYSYVFPADSGSSYDVVLSLGDNFSTITKNTSASTGYTLMHWLANGLGMAIGKVAELTGVFEVALKTRFTGGIDYPVLQAGTDLNTVTLPGFYAGKTASTAGYVNCPISSSASFTLEVLSGGDSGQITQRLTTSDKNAPKVYERFYYSGSWGDWVCISNFGAKVLWSGANYMTEVQTAVLSEPILAQPHGVVLVFSAYEDGAAKNWAMSTHFVPKSQVESYGGSAHIFSGPSNARFGRFWGKWLYIHNDKIVGHVDNTKSGTGVSGVAYNNMGVVLRHVVGV